MKFLLGLLLSFFVLIANTDHGHEPTMLCPYETVMVESEATMFELQTDTLPPADFQYPSILSVPTEVMLHSHMVGSDVFTEVFRPPATA